MIRGMLHSWGSARITRHLGVEIHPICVQTGLLLELPARAIVPSRTWRLDSKGLKLIRVEVWVRVHRVRGRYHPIGAEANNPKTDSAIVCYTCGETGLVGRASVSHARQTLWRWSDTALPRRRDGALIFLAGFLPSFVAWPWSFSVWITSGGDGSGAALIYWRTKRPGRRLWCAFVFSLSFV